MCSSIANRTARSRNSGEYGFEVLLLCACYITGNSPGVLPSGKDGAVQGKAAPRGATETVGGKAKCRKVRRSPSRLLAA